jgi:hypothetical protein
MNLTVRTYSDADAGAWDAGLESCPRATFLHSRRFLSYHGDRFRDASAIILSESGTILGLFPAALDPSDETKVVSHPGSSYGGLMHSRRLGAPALVDVFRALVSHYRELGIRSVYYKSTPLIYQRQPCEEDLYVLSRMGAQKVRCDLSATIDLQNRGQVGSRRKRGLKKALKAGLEIREDWGSLEAFWEVLEENLERKHSVNAVHSLDEISLLAKLFPDNLRLVTAALGSKVVAGTLCFDSANVSHAQYIASSREGYNCSALDPVFEHCIEWARNSGKRYFDFGISTEDQGRTLNAGLHSFKSEFGAGGTVQEFYELQL